MTILVCDKCGRHMEYYEAIKQGWLVAQRKDKPQGHLIIRCPEHITKYALRVATYPRYDNLEVSKLYARRNV